MNKGSFFSLKNAAIAVLIVLSILFPFFVDEVYYLHLAIMIIFNAILALCVAMVLTTGQATIGHAAFMGIGAYTSALLVMKLNISFWLALPLAGVMAGLVGVAVGYPTLRIKGAYFAILTFALGEVVRLVFVTWTNPFGGPSGIREIRLPTTISLGPLLVDFKSSTGDVRRDIYYLLTLAIFFLALYVMGRMMKSQYGLVFHSIRQADLLSECTGINIMRYKVLAFTVACVFGGMVGSLYAHYLRYISPEAFTFVGSVNYIIIAAVGGISSLAGPILGSLFMTGATEALRSLGDYPIAIFGIKTVLPLRYSQEFVFGLALILVLFFLPNGISGIWTQLSTRFKLFQKKEEEEEAVSNVPVESTRA